MTGELVPFPVSRSITPEQGRVAAEETLTVPIGARKARSEELRLHDSETILAVCQLLDAMMEKSPETVLEEARFFYDWVNETQSGTNYLFDEREYYLGQFAFQAGSACRFLSRREEARDWFDRAEAWFLLTSNAISDIGRLAYQ